MKLLLQAGANMNARDEDGYYALHRIAHGPGKNPECAELLLERGMPVDIRTEYGGRTALMATTYFEEREAIAGKLLEAGARIDACDILGQTALMYAAKRATSNWSGCAGRRADASLKDVFGKDALVHAWQRENPGGDFRLPRRLPAAGIRPEMTAVAASYRTSGF